MRLQKPGRGYSEESGVTFVVVLVHAEPDAVLVVDALEEGVAHRVENLVVLEAFLAAPYAHDVIQREIAIDCSEEPIGWVAQ